MVIAPMDKLPLFLHEIDTSSSSAPDPDLMNEDLRTGARVSDSFDGLDLCDLFEDLGDPCDIP